MITEKSMVNTIYEKDDYIYFMDKVYSEERSQKEVDFLVNLLNIKPGHRILDAPCGFGRHSNIFSMKGCDVVGIDYSPEFINEAKSKAKKYNLTNTFLVKDSRELNYHNEFDFTLNLGTSFGIFSHEENKRVLAKLADSLKPGGKFCLEHFSSYFGQHLKKDEKKDKIIEIDGNFLLDRVSYYEESNQIEYHRTYLVDGRRKDASLYIQLYSVEQLTVLLESFGLKTIDIYGNAKGELYTSTSPWMMIVAEKSK